MFQRYDQLIGLKQSEMCVRSTMPALAVYDRRGLGSQQRLMARYQLQKQNLHPNRHKDAKLLPALLW